MGQELKEIMSERTFQDTHKFVTVRGCKILFISLVVIKAFLLSGCISSNVLSNKKTTKFLPPFATLRGFKGLDTTHSESKSTTTSRSSASRKFASVSSVTLDTGPMTSVAFGPSPWLGYYFADFAGNGGNNLAAAAALHNNVALIFEGADSATIKIRVQEAASLGMKSVINIQYYFFGSGSSFLYPDYEARFQAFWDSLGMDQKNVVGFYLFDEPFHNNVSPGWQTSDPVTLGMNLQLAAATLHEKAPQRPVAVIFSYSEVRDPTFANHFPKSIDFVGIDCYLAWADICTPENIVADHAKLNSLMHPNQKFLFVLDGYWPSPPPASVDLALVERNYVWQNIISSYPSKIGAVIPFLYQSFTVLTDPPISIYGTQDMPSTRAFLDSYFANYPVVFGPEPTVTTPPPIVPIAPEPPPEPYAPLSAPYATICSYSWTGYAVGWRQKVWSSADCTHGLPKAGSVAIAETSNGRGTAGQGQCTISSGNHYNHASRDGNTTGSIRCLYVDVKALRRANPTAKSPATLCSYNFPDSTTGWRTRIWQGNDCTNGAPTVQSVSIGQGQNGNGTIGQVSCGLTSGQHYNPSTWGATSASINCLFVDKTLLALSVGTVLTPITLCSKAWSENQTGWRTDVFSACTSSAPTSDSIWISQSSNGNGTVGQGSCTLTSASEYNHPNVHGATSAKTECLFLSGMDSFSSSAPTPPPVPAPNTPLSSPYATVCSYSWSNNAVGWRQKIWASADCSHGLPAAGSIAIAATSNGGGTAGQGYCNIDSGNHYNHPSRDGSTSGTIRCLYVDANALKRAHPSAKSPATLCSFNFTDAATGWRTRTWQFADCSHGLPTTQSTMIGYGQNGNGTIGQVNCGLTAGKHYNHPNWGETSGSIKCLFIDTNLLAESVGAGATPVTYCSKTWTENQTGWRTDTFSSCSSGAPTSGSIWISQSSNGNGTVGQGSCTLTSASEYNHPIINGATSAKTECLFLSGIRAF